MQDITSIKPRQKIQARKVLKKKELNPKDVIGQEKQSEAASGEAPAEEERKETLTKEKVKRQEQTPVFTAVSPQDVPDGAQISKAFDTLCNIVRDRMRMYKRPEPIADFYTKGRYVLVTGDGNYPDPCFYTSTPSGGHVYVTIRDGMTSPYELYGRSTPSPPPPQPMVDPRPLSPTSPTNAGGKDDNKGGRGKDNGGKAKYKSREPPSHDEDPPPSPPSSGPKADKRGDDGPSGPTPKPEPHRASTTPSSSSSSSTSSSTSSSSSSFSTFPLTYEKVEVLESVEKFSKGRKMKGYEETSMVVETTIEKSSKKKH